MNENANAAIERLLKAAEKAAKKEQTEKAEVLARIADRWLTFRSS